MKNIRNYVYAAILAASALNFSPTLASAQEATRGKFTLTHEVHLGNAKLSAGEYEFSFDPNGGFPHAQPEQGERELAPVPS